MSELPVTVLAGMVSTAVFVVSYLPMLVKAFRTRDLTSYSLGNLVLANVGNAVHSVYVFSLPVGPIWFLHSFYVLATVLMLVWHRLYAGPRRASASNSAERQPDQVFASEAGPAVDGLPPLGRNGTGPEPGSEQTSGNGGHGVCVVANPDRVVKSRCEARRVGHGSQRRL